MVGSLTYAFATARLVGLAVKLACGFTLSLRFPSAASQPLNASVTFYEASAPLKLPARYCSLHFYIKICDFMFNT